MMMMMMMIPHITAAVTLLTCVVGNPAVLPASVHKLARNTTSVGITRHHSGPGREETQRRGKTRHHGKTAVPSRLESTRIVPMSAVRWVLSVNRIICLSWDIARYLPCLLNACCAIVATWTIKSAVFDLLYVTILRHVRRE